MTHPTPCQSPDCDRPAEAAVKIDVPGQFFVNYCREHYDAMVELVTIRTRQFAKRQMTWFRHLEEITVFETSEAEQREALAARMAQFFG